jgi:hypothetical protein
VRRVAVAVGIKVDRGVNFTSNDPCRGTSRSRVSRRSPPVASFDGAERTLRLVSSCSRDRNLQDGSAGRRRTLT